MPTRSQLTNWLTILISFLGLGLLMLDPFFYAGFTQRYLFTDPILVFIFFTAMSLFMVGWGRTRMTDMAWRVWFFGITPILGLGSILLRVADWNLYANFSFSTFHLHPENMLLPSAYAFVIGLLHLRPQLVRQHTKLFVWVISLLALILLVHFKWAYEATIFWQLKKEDGIFEYTTAFMYFGIAVIAWRTLRHWWQQPQNWWRHLMVVTYALVMIGAFVIGAEEISWGQRILGIETPEAIAQRNSQQELTIHNDELIIGHVYNAYLTLATYCATAWIGLLAWNRLGTKWLNKKLVKDISTKICPFIPPWYFFWLFVPTIIYTIGRARYGYIVVGDWEETTEMILGIGLLLFFWVRWRQVKAINKK